MSLAKQDEFTGEDISIDHEESQMHDGNHYFVKTFLADAGGAGAVTEFMFTTPDNSKRVHARSLLAPDADYTVEIFEGVTTSDDGTPIPTFNNDRDSVKTPELAPFAAPTVTDDGTLMWTGRSGGSNQKLGVAPGFNYEIIAKKNTKYLFRYVNASGIKTDINVSTFHMEL